MALIAHWPLDGRLDDISGNGYVLTNNGATMIEDSVLGSVVSLGNRNSMSITSSDLMDVFNSDNFTIIGKVFLRTDSTYNKFFITMGENKRDQFLHIGFGINSAFTFRFGGNDLTVDLPFTCRNKWITFACVCINGKKMLYINGIHVGEHSLTTLKLTKNIFRIGSEDTDIDFSINNLMIFDKPLEIDEILNATKITSIEMDFKYSIPPTVNWLDSTSKILSKGGNGITIVNQNRIKATKNSEWTESPQFNIPFKDFTVSFKLHVKQGILKRIGGHGTWNGTQVISSSHMLLCNIDGDSYNYRWSDPAYLTRTVLPGNTVNITVVFSLPSTPTWEPNNWFAIQPNRGLVNLIEYEMYDIQIEEGLTPTPFCTWSRDYLEVINKGSINKNISYAPPTGKSLPDIRRDRLNLNNGTSWALNFTSSNQVFQIENIFFRKNTTITSVVLFRAVDITKEYWIANQYIPNDSNRFILGVKNGKIWILYGSIDLYTEVLVQQNVAYHITATIDDTSIKIYVNGTLSANVNVVFEPCILNGGIKLGNGVLSGEYYVQNNIISDFKLYPIVLTPTQIEEEYESFKQYTASFSSAFEGNDKVLSLVPKLWEQNPNTDGTNCFTGVVNASNYDIVPLSWGGRVKPLSNTLQHGVKVQKHEIIAPIIIDLRTEVK